MTSDGAHAQRSDDAAEIRRLVARAQRGSIDAFAQLVHRYQDRLFNYLRLRAGNEHDAEDLAQESFLRAWKSIDRFDDRWAFSTWLFAIASHVGVDHLRRDGRRRRNHAAIEQQQQSITRSAADAEHPGAEALVREQADNLWSLAASVLSENERAAMWLHYAEQLSAAAIGEVLDSTAANVRVMLHRARKRLRQHVEQQTSGDDEHASAPGVPYVYDAPQAGAGASCNSIEPIVEKHKSRPIIARLCPEMST